MVDTDPSREHLRTEETRLIRRVVLIVGVLVALAYMPFILRGHMPFDLSAQAALRLRGTLLFLSYLLLIGVFGYIGLSAWRRGYIFTTRGIIERRRQPAAFMIRIFGVAFIGVSGLLWIGVILWLKAFHVV